MTFSINPTATKTQALFQQMAISQNGTGTGSAITGNGGSAGTGSSAGSSSELSTATLASLPGSGTGLATGTASLPAGTGVVSGSGSLNSDGSCSCFVQCATGSFPAVQAQGLGAFGGMPGMFLPSLSDSASTHTDTLQALSPPTRLLSGKEALVGGRHDHLKLVGGRRGGLL